MVTPQTSEEDLPSCRMASTATSRANVESRPPETPITALEPIISSRCFRPATCIRKISMQRANRSVCTAGTKGSLVMGNSVPSLRGATSSPIFVWASMAEKVEALSEKLLLLRRSARIRPRSQSRTSRASETMGSSVCPKRRPFWAMRHWPEKIKSWVLSPAPAEA